MPTRVKSQTTASSQKVVATAASSLFERQTYQELVLQQSDSALLGGVVEAVTGFGYGNGLTSSLMPRRVALNAPVTQKLVDGPKPGIATAVEENNKKRMLQARPTADYIKRSTFKTGSKLLIKIEPTTKSTKIRDYVPNLIFDKFSLQNIAEPDAERYQLHETFESEVLFLFGRRPRIWTMQGIVLNGKSTKKPSDAAIFLAIARGEKEADILKKWDERNHDWCNQLLADWDDFYRGSMAVEHRARTYLTYDDSVTEATLLELTVVRNSQIPSAVNATLTFVVHQRAFVGQEYRDGITAPNLAELIDQTNASGSFQDKIKPSEIEVAEPTTQELQRRERVSEERVQEKEQIVREKGDELSAVEKAALTAEQDGESDREILENLAREKRGVEEYLDAADPVADAEDIRVAEDHLEELKKLEYKVEKQIENADARYQAAVSTITNTQTATTEAVSSEQDAVSEHEVNESYTQNTTAATTSSDDTSALDTQLENTQPQYTEFHDVVYETQPDGSIKVTFSARDKDTGNLVEGQTVNL